MCVCITIYEYLLLLLSMVCWVCLWVCIIKGCVSTYAYTSLCYFLWTHLCTWTGHNFTSNDKISLKPKWIHCTSKLSQLFVTSQFYSGLKTNIVTNTPHFIKSQEHKMQITKYKLSFNLLSCFTWVKILFTKYLPDTSCITSTQQQAKFEVLSKNHEQAECKWHFEIVGVS